jgi:hypothetical protein
VQITRLGGRVNLQCLTYSAESDPRSRLPRG